MVRESNFVRRMPLIRRAGLNFSLIVLISSWSCLKPWRLKKPVSTGVSTSVAAMRADCVKALSVGAVSIIMKSNSGKSGSSASFNRNRPSTLVRRCSSISLSKLLAGKILRYSPFGHQIYCGSTFFISMSWTEYSRFSISTSRAIDAFPCGSISTRSTL